MKPIIKVDHIRKVYRVGHEKVVALNDINLSINQMCIRDSYTTTDEDDNETSGTFVLSVSHDPSQPLPEESESEATQDESEETEEEEITAYARVGESPIVYKISTDAYKALMAS